MKNIYKFMFGENYQKVIDEAKKRQESVDTEKSDSELARLQEEFRKTVTLDIAAAGKGDTSNFPVEEAFYSMTKLNRIIKLSSSRYNDRKKTHLIRGLDEKIKSGVPFIEDVSTGSCSVESNLGGWNYLVVLDKNKELWVVDYVLTRTIYKLKIKSAL